MRKARPLPPQRTRSKESPGRLSNSTDPVVMK
jgi:hypothetical protein